MFSRIKHIAIILAIVLISMITAAPRALAQPTVTLGNFEQITGLQPDDISGFVFSGLSPWWVAMITVSIIFFGVAMLVMLIKRRSGRAFRQ